MGKAYRGLNIGTRAVTSVFLYSFSGGTERGATISEIKRSATTMENPASVVAEAVEQLKSKLFYLQNTAEKYFFNNQPNLNRILIKHMENIKDHELIELERDLIRSSVKGGRLKVTIWEDSSGNIADSEELKLVILKKEDKQTIHDIIKYKGQTPRVYRNTLVFLYPLEAERPVFNTILKRKIAYENIEQDKTLNLSEDQKKEVKKELKKAEEGLMENDKPVCRYFREQPSLAFSGNEVMISEAFCSEQRKQDEPIIKEPPPDQQEMEGIPKPVDEMKGKGIISQGKFRDKIQLSFTVPIR